MKVACGLAGAQFLDGRRDVGRRLRVRAAGSAQHLEGDHRLAVETGVGADFGATVTHGAELVEPHRAPVRQRDRQRRQIVDAGRGAECANRIFARAEVATAAAEIDVGRRQLLADRRGGHVEGGQPLGIEVDVHLLVDAADAAHVADRGQPLQEPVHGVVDEVGKLFHRHRRIGHGVGQDRQAGDVEALDDRLVDRTGQVGADAADGVLDVVERLLGIGLEAEFDQRRRGAVDGGGGDVLDTRHRGDRIFDRLADLVHDFGRGRTRLGHRDDDEGHVDIGKARHRQTHEADETDGHECQEYRDRWNGIADRPGGEVHRRASARSPLPVRPVAATDAGSMATAGTCAGGAPS